MKHTLILMVAAMLCSMRAAAQQRMRIVAERTYRYDISAGQYALHDEVRYGYTATSTRGLSMAGDTVFYDTMRHYTPAGDSLLLKDREDMHYNAINKVDTAYSGIAEDKPYKPVWMRVYTYNDSGHMLTSRLYANASLRDDARVGVHGPDACDYTLVQIDSFVYRNGLQTGTYKYCYRPNCLFYPEYDNPAPDDTLMLLETLTYRYDGNNPVYRTKTELAGEHQQRNTIRRMHYTPDGRLLAYSTYATAPDGTAQQVDTFSRTYRYGKQSSDVLIEHTANRRKWVRNDMSYNSAGLLTKNTWQVEWHNDNAPAGDTALHTVWYTYNTRGQKVKERYEKYKNKHQPQPDEVLTRSYTYNSQGYPAEERSEHLHNTPRGTKHSRYKATYIYEVY